MAQFNLILEKLNQFIKKYYTLRLLKGLFLFLTLATLIWLVFTGVEYFLWLGKTGRLLLLVCLVLIEGFLLYRFILTPLFYLISLKRGINYKEASLLIGQHFKEVDDKLFNLVELSSNSKQSDLLLASINQKSKQLSRINFNLAVDFRDSLRFAKYLLIPALIIGVLWIGGYVSNFIESYNRIKNYDLAYTPPAPFTFMLENNKLHFLEGEEVEIKLSTKGKVQPSQLYLVYEGNRYLMAKSSNLFTHNLVEPSTGSFYFEAEGFNSRTYNLVIGSVPRITDFSIRLVYPIYLNKENQTISGTGNTEVPEGTLINWQFKTSNTDKIVFIDSDSIAAFNKDENNFSFQKRVYSNTDYQVSTSNNNAANYESLNYSVSVIKDKFPNIEVTLKKDSLTFNRLDFQGTVSDDYAVKEIALWYYPLNNPSSKKKKVLSKLNSTVGSFAYQFPSGLNIDKSGDYELYFEVKDNDGIHGGKVSKSQTYRTSLFNQNELEEKELDAYKTTVKQFDNEISKANEQHSVLKQLNEKQSQSESLDYEDKQEVKKFLESQQNQEALMKKFSKNLKKQIEKTESANEFNQLLKERLERQEMEAEKNRKLLEELNKIADKIDKEELKSKLEELSKKQSSGKRNLEQLLELTKRYYVTEKANQLAKKLEDLANKQDKLSKTDNLLNSEKIKNTQEQLNNDYNKLSKELKELKEENEELKKPLSIAIDEDLQEQVKQEQKESLSYMGKDIDSESSSKTKEKDKEKSASDKMKSAAQKMKQLGNGLQQAAAMGGGSSITEDAEMLRQILDNLVTFSFQQEELFDKVSASGFIENETSFVVRKQQDLRGLFEHVDDSLFALSLRQPDLSEFVNEQITEVYYNIDKSLDNITENQIFQGASYQQYVLNAANSLSEYLAKLLDNMQQSMMSGNGSGQGSQDGFQLPDIIKAQQQLKEKAGNAQGNGKKEDTGEGKQSGTKAADKKGDGKESGKSSKGDAKNGQNGTGGDNSKLNSKKENSGIGVSENNLEELYEIYKEQQQIRSMLEKQLKNFINASDKNLAKKLTLQMEAFENDLLENGITQSTRNKLNTIQHQLLKLENAALKQGRKKKRESVSNTKEFDNSLRRSLLPKSDGSPLIEILDRQALPLQQNLQKKVKGYFENRD
ncbi:ATPase [Croceivirga lutea]|uniref:DUF4175 family protein n=1 Tax=Croceivirga lutea TaxID=1775167 RepID=UPI0016399F47|nr:DUF4175 family protein [Croceivirga lutea]GGG38822.1 ATPase [Croceivirga lutea]